MTVTDRIVVIRGAGGTGPDDVADRTYRDALHRLDPFDVADVADAVERLAGDPDTRPDVPLAVIGPDVEHPMSVARELRRADGAIGLAFVVEPSEAEALEIRLGMVPELRGAIVVVAEGSARDLEDSLRDAAGAAARRREVRGTLDAMNVRLLRGSGDEARTPERESVSESYLAALTRHMPEAIVSVDREGRIVALNDEAAETFGLSAEAAEGATFADAVDPDPDGAVHRMVRQALAGDTTTGREVEVVTVDGRPLLASVTAAAVRDHAERIVGAVLLARDITDERRTQQRLQELQKAQSLATLAGGVAHDFNNLLVAVKGWAELAAADVADVDLVTKALDRIRLSADRAAELARSMLVYSGRGSFELEPVDLSEVVRELTELLHGTVSRKTSLELELDDELPVLQADVTQLRQVVMNLITNAAEALGDDPGTITIRACVTDRLDEALADGVGPAAQYVLLEVADTGPGMDETIRQRVFEPFFTTKFEGRGLGLAASHGIVRAHGGSLVVESQPGRGATFRMVLPAAADQPA